ncbi:MAG: NAD(P) transhydrogenase subunit alpha [Prolixibacteraceae bacterium]|jgi:NAD(P) transhydrogenase subunit alpha|nr:NAD(P) transhydrogenase subunit alpha [Prolixibacteraceae bacterium]MDD4755229.1 NAD(P) transhydrogenase subunit alpha [Prolixibacteraceae bacterium]NLO00767.1 NAD(P) transhydrogenase subunit alpha [Bacteroidales bacterium]
MTSIQLILVVIFIVAAVVGYLLINNVPSRLHTPLMSGMNALSGVTIVGALLATAGALSGSNPVVGYIFGTLAIILAMINVAGGFAVTDRMLGMFGRNNQNRDKDD